MTVTDAPSRLGSADEYLADRAGSGGQMIAEAKVAVVAAELTVVGAVGAWSSRFVASALQSSGITVSPDLVVQLVTTAVMVAIAYATLRSEVKSTRESHKDLAKKFSEFERTLNQVVTDLAVLTATAARVPQQRQRRQPADDAEDV